MIRGTTPTHTFNLTFDVSLIKKVKITYAQDNTAVIAKTTKDCTLSGSSIAVKLSQEDTLKFDHRKTVEIQVRILTQNNAAMASKIKRVSVERCLDCEVLA